MPLSLRKQTAGQLQYLVDNLANRLPKWKAALMPKSGRLTLVQLVLCAMPIHAMMALDLPIKTIEAMIKICRGFLWCRRMEAKGGNCAVAWDAVCAPKWAGGLGLRDLRWMNVAMQSRWPWLKRTDGTRPWNEFNIKVPKESMQIYQAATASTANDGRTTLFWEDRWLHGQRVQEIAPLIYSSIPKRIQTSMVVRQATEDAAWARDVGPNLGPDALQQFLLLWQSVSTWEVVESMQDTTSWSWETNGQFSV